MVAPTGVGAFRGDLKIAAPGRPFARLSRKNTLFPPIRRAACSIRLPLLADRKKLAPTGVEPVSPP